MHVRSSVTVMASDLKKHPEVIDPGSEYGCNFPEVTNLLL